MATNTFINNLAVTEEQRLIEELTIESIRMYGHDVYYIPRAAVNEDPIFGEDPTQKYEQAFSIEAYIQNVDGFEGEGDFVGRFGLEIRDSITFAIARRRFEETITTNTIPLEGDLIYFPLSQGLFEIKFVEHENPFYQLGKLHTYQISCDLFRYSQETIDVGIAEIDSVEKESGVLKKLVFLADEIRQEDGSSDVYLTGDKLQIEHLTTSFMLSEGTPSGNFTVDEIVYQGATQATATATGKVVYWDGDDRTLKVQVQTGEFKDATDMHILLNDTLDDEDRVLMEDGDILQIEDVESLVTGASSAAAYAVFTVTDETGNIASDDGADFETKADSVLDFTEGNPFGEFGNLDNLEI